MRHNSLYSLLPILNEYILSLSLFPCYILQILFSYHFGRFIELHLVYIFLYKFASILLKKAKKGRSFPAFFCKEKPKGTEKIGSQKPLFSVPNWFLVLFYDSYHICYGLESIFLHVLLDAFYNIHCNCRIVEICCSYRHCTCTCEYHLNCIFC